MLFNVFLSILFLVLVFFIFQLFCLHEEERIFISSRPFECGVNPLGSPRVPFSLRFFIIAVLFIIFDVELVLLVPVVWASKFCLSYFCVRLVLFLVIVLAGLMYEWTDGSLAWVNLFCSSLNKTPYLYYDIKIFSTYW